MTLTTTRETMKPSDIKTTYRFQDMQFARVTLPGGREFRITGHRYRCGQRGKRSYAWSFTLDGPGLAHVAPEGQRDATWTDRTTDIGGPTYVSINVVTTHCSTMTSAKRYLVKLLERLDAR